MLERQEYSGHIGEMVDLVPEGTIPLAEAYERYCSWLWHGCHPRIEIEPYLRLNTLPAERTQTHRAAADEVVNLQLAEMGRPFALGALQALVRSPQRLESLEIPASAWRDEFFPERFFLSPESAPGHGPFFDAAAGRTPFVFRAKLETWLRDEDGKRDRIRSRVAVRELLIGLVMDGAMPSTKAEAFAKAWKLEALSSRPNGRRFDPNRRPTWSLAMVVSWIVWRDLTKVREALEEYRTECWDWFGLSRRLPIDGGRDWYEVRGEELRHLGPISVTSIGLLEAMREDLKEGLKLTSVKSAREELWGALAEGRLVATGLNANREVVKIPSHEWPYLELASDKQDRDYVFQRAKGLNAAYSQLQISRLATQATWPQASEQRDEAPDPADSLFDLNEPDWTLLEAAIWVGSEGRRFSSKQIADEDLEVHGATLLFRALFRDPRLVATGLGPTRVREAVPAVYWELATIDPNLHRQRHYVSFIDEVLGEEGGQMTPFGEVDPRWFGIRLKRDALFEAFPELAPSSKAAKETKRAPLPVQKTSRKRNATREAIAVVYPNGIPSGLSDKARLTAINTWLEENGHSRVSLATIERAAKSR